MTTLDHIKALGKQLLPKGLAFNFVPEGYWDTRRSALAISENAAYTYCTNILNQILPDNDHFTADDASAWEARLGMVNSTAPLADRKLAIKRKLAHPGRARARQSALYLQGQLQAAGFDVYVYANRFASIPNFVTQDPVTVFGGSGFLDNQHGQFQHGQRNHGGQWGDVIANHLDPDLDRSFSVGSNLRSTFFICGNPLGTICQISSQRRREFRDLVLRIKPAQTVAYVYALYV